MSKTIEEIKEEVSREFLHPYRTWLENSRFSNDDNISVLEDSGAIDEVAERYAQSQTQELIEQNAELVDILSRIVEKQFDSKYSLQSLNIAISEAKELLTKYNHLNKKP